MRKCKRFFFFLVLITIGYPTVAQLNTDSLINATHTNIDSLFSIKSDSEVNKLEVIDSIFFRDTAQSVIWQQAFADSVTASSNDLDSTNYIDSLTIAIQQDSAYPKPFFPVRVDSMSLDSILYNMFSDSSTTIQTYRLLDSLFTLEYIPKPEEVQRNYEAETSLTTAAVPQLQGVVINGRAIVDLSSVFHYKATFAFPPGGASGIKWYVSGGTIVSKNEDPSSGEVFVEVQWHYQAFNNLFQPFVYLVDYSSGQFGVLQIYVGDPGCVTVPANQLIYYGQEPCQLTVGNCIEVSSNTTYQWQVRNVFQFPGWHNIQNANSDTYQPPNLADAVVFYRRQTTTTVNGVMYNAFTSPARVGLQSVNGGIISSTNITVPYNSLPDITSVSLASGGYTPTGYQYDYYWETSINNGPWQIFANGLNYPTNHRILFNNTRIRRGAHISNIPAVSGLVGLFLTGYSNIITFNTVYASVDYENKTYVRTNSINISSINTWEAADQLTSDKKKQTTVYLDGLGRAIQKVGKGSHFDSESSQWYDMVQTISYEAGGRVDPATLPYPSLENFGKYKNNYATDQPAYYSTKFYGETNAYAKVDYDNSPEDRILKKYAPGQSWGGSNIGVYTDYEPYLANEDVHYWDIGFNSTDLPYTQNSYSDRWIIKTYTVDEKNKKVINYTDRSGHVILKKVQLEDGSLLTSGHDGWLCTYYVYDDLDQLRYMIPPKAVKWLSQHNWQFTQEIADDLCFYYLYDERGRTVMKKVPGKGKQEMVYDKRNRLVFTQDANQKAKLPNEWLVNFYDQVNRNVLTGLYKSNSSRGQLQTDANNANGFTTITVPGSAINNLIVSERKTIVPRYAATTSIEFQSNFESVNNDNFIAEIDPSAIGPSETLVITASPVPQIDIADPSKFTALIYNYFDNYSYPGAKLFADANIQFGYEGATFTGVSTTIAKTLRTYGMPTGSKVRVLDESGTLAPFLISTAYYDEESQTLQVSQENIKGGTDVSSLQYHFNGQVLSSYENHGHPGSAFNDFSILTKYKFDQLGRVIGTGKKLGAGTSNFNQASAMPGLTEDNDATYKIIATYKYDELGHRVKKTLSPKFNETGLESLEYDYNIRGWLTGINKNYALEEYTGDQFQHFFGMYLGYDNRDNQFASNQLNGQITGTIWKSQGDNTPRKYDFQYDNSNRLIKADFNQKGDNTESWNKTRVDLSVKNISYDENGNLLAMTQMGILPTATTPVIVDQLAYIYKENSNKLLRIDDIGGLGSNNGKLGDFKDGTNGTGGNAVDDYSYDENGNLATDKNKNIIAVSGNGNAITYNYLDKPILINVQGKGTMQYIYDAEGSKLQKIVTENSPVVKVTTTTYVGDYVYEKTVITGSSTQPADELEYITHEEGRIRIINPSTSPAPASNYVSGGIQVPGNKMAVFDYFITDNLGNIRSVVTDQDKSPDIYLATLEEDKREFETQLFNRIPENDTPKPTGFDNDANNSVVAVTNATSAEKRIGPNILLKVMAGDKVKAITQAWYLPNVDASVPTGLSGIISNLITSLSSGVQNLSGGKTSGVDLTNNNILDPGVQNFLNNQNNNSLGSRPKAYLNWILLDEQQFKVVNQSSGFTQVPIITGTQQKQLLQANSGNDIEIKKNGYLFIYVSNESLGNVYFDDIKIDHKRSALVEENHYYSYGLKIEGISSKAMGTLNNDKKYQGIYNDFTSDFDINWNDFDLRNYDPQIGRFTTSDPFEEFPSPYLGMGSDPINNVDPSGGFIACPVLNPASVGMSFLNIAAIASTTLAIGVSSSFNNGANLKAPTLTPPDDYYLDGNGNLLGVRRTNDNFDRFYEVQNAVNDPGSTKLIVYVLRREKGIIVSGPLAGLPDVWSRISDVNKVQIVHAIIPITRTNTNTDEMGVPGKMQVEYLKLQSPYDPNPGIALYATPGGGYGIVHLNDPPNPQDATPNYIIPPNSTIPAPDIIQGKAILPEGAFSPNLLPTLDSVRAITDAKGDVIPLWKYKLR